MIEKLLVIGAGFLGNTIFQLATKTGLTTSCTNKTHGSIHLDIREIHMIEKVINSVKPDLIINCAALTNIDEIEREPKTAYDVNSIGAGNIAKIAKKNKIKFVHISTDGVFDGSERLYLESDKTNPINEYAKSKKLGEDLVLETYDDSILVRTNFYGHNNENKFLFNWILNNLKQNQKFTAFSDVIFNPLEICNLSLMILDIMKTDFRGIVNIAGDEIISKYQFAYKIAKTLNFDTNLVESGSIKNSSLIANRPLNTSLSNKLAKSLITTEIIPLEKWLKEKFLNVS